MAAIGALAADRFEAEIVGLDESGAGVAEVADGGESLLLHVTGALPGERIAGRITFRSVHVKSARREAWADLEALVRSSPNRVTPECPAQGKCGGCAIMHLSYQAQLAWKRTRVCEEFAKHPTLASVEVAPCVPSPATFGYRNQAKYIYARCQDGDVGDVVLGAYAPRSHDVVDLAGCRVVEPILDQAREVLLGVLRACAVEPFHEVRRTGTLRYAILRANRDGRVLATLVAASAEWDRAQSVAEDFACKLPALAGVVLNVNPAAGNALLGGEEHLLVGQPSIDDEMGDVRVRLAARSFFQANREVGSRIYRDLVAGLRGDFHRAVDAYAGAGGIALSLVARAKEVVAVEANAAATTVALAAWDRPDFCGNRPRVITGDAAAGLAAIDAADLVVLNPPRKGCSEAVLAEVRRLSPRSVVYLSCDPRTLARDLAILARAGATITRAIPYDMMPHTPHVETLVTLSLGD